eukprot:13558-Heterococcus_DN1.PRE.2
MAQPDAAWLADFAREHGRAPAALFEARMGAVRAENLQQHQQQLEAATAQHQEQVAANQQQQQELVAVQAELDSRIQELDVCKKALADVRTVLDAMQPPAAVQQPVLNDVNDELEANELAAACDDNDDEPAQEAHVAPEAAQPAAKRARVDKATPEQLKAYNEMFAYMSKHDDESACEVFNDLSETDKVAVAVRQSTTKNNLLIHAFYEGSLETAKLLVSKGATKELVADSVDCISDWLDHFNYLADDGETDYIHKQTKGLALLVMLGMPIASAWTCLKSNKWKKSSSLLRPVLGALLSTLNVDYGNTSALVEHLITSLDIKGREKDGEAVDASVCQFDSVERLMPNNAPDWLVTLVATIFSMQYEQGGAAIAQEMRPIIIDHFNFDIPA